MKLRMHVAVWLLVGAGCTRIACNPNAERPTPAPTSSEARP